MARVVADHGDAAAALQRRHAGSGQGAPASGTTPADAAHELRAPLHSLLLWTEVLERQLGQAPEPVARALAGIRKAVQQQVHIVETMLEGRR